MSSLTGARTVDDVLEIVGMGRAQYTMLTALALLLFGETTEIMLLSFLSPLLGCEWKLSDVQKASLTSFVFVGWLVGAMFWGWWADRVGRKKAILHFTLILAAFGLGSAASPNFTVLLMLRTMVGFASGGIHISVTLVTECIPISQRGTVQMYMQLVWPFGTVLLALIAWWIIPLVGWRWFTVVCTAPVLLSLLSFGFIPESPRWDLQSGNRKEA